MYETTPPQNDLKSRMFLFQALQSKHDALLKRVDELDNECEELRDRVLEAEGERDDLQGVVENLQIEKDKVSEELDSKQVIVTRFCAAVFCTAMKFNVYVAGQNGIWLK